MDKHDVLSYLEYLDNLNDKDLPKVLERETKAGHDEQASLVRREMRGRGLLSDEGE